MTDETIMTTRAEPDTDVSTLPRYYVQGSNIGWQVRDRDQGCIVQIEGRMQAFESLAKAGKVRKELEAAHRDALAKAST
jgi:hypothetical protein